MNLIQFFLLIGAVGSFVLYLKFLRSTLRDRMIGILLFATAVLSIFFPDLTTMVAQFLGVGRGTDLLIYVFITASIFGFVLFYTRLIATEEKLTALIRHIAIENAERPASSAEGT